MKSLRQITLSVAALSLISAALVNSHDKPTTIGDAGVLNDSLSHQVIRIINLPINDTSYASVLKPPVSHSLRWGFVSLLPKCSGEKHSTEAYEEMIIILDGQSVLHSGDNDMSLTTGQVAYISPFTTHMMSNRGTTTPKYLYIVTKVK
jgi:quercetin dioxygenase-like cupin family protein